MSMSITQHLTISEKPLIIYCSDGGKEVENFAWWRDKIYLIPPLSRKYKILPVDSCLAVNFSDRTLRSPENQVISPPKSFFRQIDLLLKAKSIV